MRKYLLPILLLAWGFSQDLESLTSEQKKEYNRSKLTVEEMSKNINDLGLWYMDIISSRVNGWYAFKGLSVQINTEEFFRLTGYDEEADMVNKRSTAAMRKIIAGGVLYVIGNVAQVIPVQETENIGGYEFVSYSYPLLLPGIAIWATGLYLGYSGLIDKYKPITPYQTAIDIADEYNKNLIKDILNK